MIVALDFPDRIEVHRFLDHFDEPLFVKVGMELFYREGPVFIEELKSHGHSIFLDLKLHDIPTTVERAMTNIARLEVDLVNVHALGGRQMMQQALEGLEKGTPAGKNRPQCIGVTHLTSSTEEMISSELGIKTDLNEHVLHLAKLTNQSGLDGVVCSAHEVEEIKRAIGSEFLTVTPGIRLKSDSADDQHRIVTPKEASRIGSGAIVVGRGITRAQDVKKAYRAYNNEWRNS
ncbi:orotidine-5'-phosphate decarboxylase [Bacillus sp. H-16]|uniref:orotidine-5'-phosphate decarboxylase n=1 Tax=Alteribacter salitolerans TaxID=2912333 RepID=UPI001964665D|nr:orotidine-5'-phosphate decarboxylase [Alteribacter salitolerans]MBM7095835.1 orotidine-5'-phosphate decarboxylase [Alteribacter salitolerans]